MAARTTKRKTTPSREQPQYIQSSQGGLPLLVKILLPILVVLLVASAFLIGVLWTKLTYVQKQGTTTTATTTGTTKPTVSLDTIKGLFSKDLLKFGDANKKVLFVEVGDPSCPYCHIAGGYDPEIAKQVNTRFQYASDGGSYVPPVPQIEKLVNDGKASFVYIYYPGHQNGEVGMTALYCANEQDKFWPAHDVLMTEAGYNFVNNTKVKYDPSATDLTNGFKKATDADYAKIASFLSGTGIDTGKLTGCLSSKKYVARLSSDANLAINLGTQGTPGFFVNATQFNGAYSWTDMKSVVDSALK